MVIWTAMLGGQQAQSFEAFFCTAVNERPFAFQARFADDGLPTLTNVPTGLGKTAMAVVGWLWRRFGARGEVCRQTPRRLVYCLPMRVLVEQTRDNAVEWLRNLREGSFVKRNIPVHVLMGGEDEDDWDIHPEREAIIIGTQDMLLSRALNRGYAASRSRWPMQFGLLHTDCLWVFDEIQLMGSGLATTAQLEAFRRLLPTNESSQAKDGHGCRSVWMSATLQRNWLNTVDFKDRVDGLACLELSEDDRKQGEVAKRWNAKKPLTRANATMGDASNLANEVRQAHKLGTRTIVVMNTVRRACELFIALNPGGDGQTTRGKKAAKKQKPQGEESETTTTAPRIVLLHSCFRPNDRKKRIDEALADPPAEGTIVVSTQVIEAGVDVSAKTLFTELAPWASLVQRFGRCNRRGDDTNAQVFWIDLPGNAKDKDAALPYELDDLKAAAEQLRKLKDIGPKSLPKVELRFEHSHVIRRKDLLDLFDTTPDLAGNDIDIDRFVREVEHSDVRVFWRTWDRPNGHEPPPEDEPAPRREELCPGPVGEFKKFASGEKRKGKVWRWDFLDKKWEKPDADKIAPGQVYLVHADAGGYSLEQGCDFGAKRMVHPPLIDDWSPSENASLPEQWTSFAQAIRKQSIDLDAYDDDGLSKTDCWKTIAEHTDDVRREISSIIGSDATLTDAERSVLTTAARWHDLGKAHEMFQIKIDDGQELAEKGSQGNPKRRRERDGEHRHWQGRRDVAKAPGERKDQDGKVVDSGFWTQLTKKDGGRYHFRHELASAMAVLQRPHSHLQSLSDDDLNLVAYLVAAHHGKVRLAIRSLPRELRPRDKGGERLDSLRFARGVWDGDGLRETDLGQDDDGRRIIAPRVTLSLEPMELGLCEQPPFAGQPSWAERMIRLRDTLGPFRLAYLEAILRAADMRASKAAERHEARD